MKDPKDIQLTQEGYDNLQKELDELAVKRPGVLKRMVEAREQGDLSENAGYHAAKDELANIDYRTRELKLILRLAQISNSNGAGIVAFGSSVKIKNGEVEMDYIIVSELEADPSQGKVSDVSPIGKALLGKKVGDTIEIEISDGKMAYEVLEIR